MVLNGGREQLQIVDLIRPLAAPVRHRDRCARAAGIATGIRPGETTVVVDGLYFRRRRRKGIGYPRNPSYLHRIKPLDPSLPPIALGSFARAPLLLRIAMCTMCTGYNGDAIITGHGVASSRLALPVLDLLAIRCITTNNTPFSSLTHPDQVMKNPTIPRLLSRALFIIVLLPVMSLSLYAQQVPSITSFNLIDADTDTPIAVLEDGYELLLDSLASRNINIEAIADSGDFSIRRVHFHLATDGVWDYYRRGESVAPYALWGDSPSTGDFFPGNLDPAAYMVSATPYYHPDPVGDPDTQIPGDSLIVSFTATGTAATFGLDTTLVITDWILSDGAGEDRNSLDLFSLEDGMNLYRGDEEGDVPDSLYIRAEGTGIASIFFVLTGAGVDEETDDGTGTMPYEKTEGGAPFDIFSDPHHTESGVMNLKATPWSLSPPGAGNEGISTEINIAFPGFVLINADTDMPIMEIADGDTLDLSAQTTNINIQAAFLNVGSVVFTLDGGDTKTETAPPYALAGDAGGDYAPLDDTAELAAILEPGTHTLEATPYTESGGQGDALRSVSATIHVTGMLTVTGADDSPEIPDGFAIESLYPNPFNPTTTMRVTLDRSGDYQMRVFNVLGQLVEQRSFANQIPGSVSVPVSMEGRASGMYFFAFEQKATGKVVTAKAVLMK